MEKFKIGFDFDGTLDSGNSWIQPLVKSLIADENNEVFLITTRVEPEDNKKTDYDQITILNKEVIVMADHLGIKRQNIYFTNWGWKHELIDKLELRCFFDDNEIEVHLINTKCFLCQGILVGFDIKSKWLKELCSIVDKKLEFK